MVVKANDFGEITQRQLTKMGGKSQITFNGWTMEEEAIKEIKIG